MKIDQATVEKVAMLARLELASDEEEKMTEQLNDILDYADKLNELDTEDVKPTAHALPIKNVFREDVVEESLDRDIALKNAPEKESGSFKVPKVIETGE
ncbi:MULTISPECIES: Asp-tRNA(Asn)/Glu-tRNA(Gln) amidotransferase subunit GatC [unclassified Candidatus Frackibacter]|uniref:Asp-tRNA(Asn)/Glu-tRNA(Gln) amidotransferase subunit GatC n=1 Tax=unclassified Candidatus Frackibacter TaxID=2648818 RepID=UPI00079622A6|nr:MULTISPECIES: Asp-tRNA(Asn)/Glu-tRNA(Gln) amidotransferase subunit GatC [unclassified Candidatus Frackibacter]KXS45273.1 MAG: aspartyl-tRNA(Asn)/glutamyl-tRNA (Gln) amidotransferase subunit C [Candidatus Frackibacter sp. T328-2]SDC79148.1 aspartyl/glutamyl-tRNA(Asn/Gln) amidotransferase subunit C [Candidatus Frackibacter sp. WG11]SEM91891.1 aspartyl/glutamyl-tRNA(Asn/Gln) amidotransferase subunit C [Candidatus Frackibacter sp. WG12]SFM01663.1 aspartyl/glutamyl-tRNA(Asn/Gln) amidotransferase 